jgi:integrase
VPQDFKQLSIDTLAKLQEFGIKSKSVYKWFKHSCRKLETYLCQKGIGFSLESGLAWLAEVRPQESLTHSQYVTHAAMRRVVYLLSECQERILNSWHVYPVKTAARPQTPEYILLLHTHKERLRKDGMAESTIAFAMRVDSDFLIYLEENKKNMIGDIMPCDVVGYFSRESFSGRKPDGVRAYAYKLKSFLSFLEEMGKLGEKKLNLTVPKVFAKHETIVTVLSDEAATALMDGSIQPDVATSSRDRAMILLALRLGLRKSDIVNMRIGDIDWENDQISITQQKTGVPVTLPLLSDVGNAIMDYVLNHRPKTSYDKVFLRYYAPYQPIAHPLRATENFLNGFTSEDCPERGFHILRRTLATRMLRRGIPRSVISASIGQVDPNSVDEYLSADVEKMRNCAISLKGIEIGRGCSK